VKLRIALYFSSLFLLVVGSAAAQNPGYRVSGLTSDRPGANYQSPTLLNPWGIAFLPGQGFFIAENASGRVVDTAAPCNRIEALLRSWSLPRPELSPTRQP